MNSIAIASIAFACMFGGALFGLFLRRHLPEQHLNPDARDVVKLGAGLIATMAALVLGLMVSSAKASFDKVNDGLIQRAANFANLDRIMDQYGPETNEARTLLRSGLVAMIERLNAGAEGISADELSTELETVGDMLRTLTPRDESQRLLKGALLQRYGEGMALRWSLIQQARASIPTVFLVVLVFWFTVLFGMFTLLSPGNATVRAVMFLCAVSVAGGIVLTLDMNRPFVGLVKVSSVPLEHALESLGR